MQDFSALSDNDLIIEARNGDNLAFANLFYRYDKKVFSIAAQYFQSSDDAKDVYQEVFIRVYKGLKKFEFRSEFATWLFRVTTNVCLTHKAQYKKFQSVSISPDENDESPKIDLKSSEENEPDNQMIESERKGKVQRAIDSLAPNQRMAFMLKHIHNYKIREIAKMMECSEGTVKKYLFIATDKLRLKLKTI
ncbi:MAG: RNA polymerase sigma factor [Ignavibacteriaceae bacterium]|nr:RNA polymerase sigma factor [Ignavibacteriaceae bacterium]